MSAPTNRTNSAVAHALSNPFIAAAALSALVHSAWSFSTFFSGAQPVVSAVALDAEWLRQHAQLLGWLIPGFAIAFALDIGQVNTSAEIRDGNRTFAKYATFVIFSVVTYALQWMYLIHHTPALPLGGGVPEQWAQTVTDLSGFVRIWVLPAALPLATLMYTFGDASHNARTERQPHDANALTPQSTSVHPSIVVTPPALPVEPMQMSAQTTAHNAAQDAPQFPTYTAVQNAPAQMPMVEVNADADVRVHRSGASGGRRTGATDGNVSERTDGKWIATCPHCGETMKSAYKNESAARNALSAHMGRWCKSKPEGVR